jgi:hypothetical protein
MIINITTPNDANVVSIVASVNSNDASALKVTATGSTTPRTLANRFADVVNVKDFGAVGDGVTDDRSAIQAAFNYAASISNCTIFFPNGTYYLGIGYTDSSNSVQLVLGNTNSGSAIGIILQGNGSKILQGAVGRALGLYGCDKIQIQGFTFFGYTGGALISTRENDAIIAINYSSYNITINDNYLTNSLGDCIYIGGSLVSGGGTGYDCRNIQITNNTLKQRYGNGVPSVSGGTESRHAISIIDASIVRIENNTIYGIIDLEPNLDGQHQMNISICNNQFQSGNVTAQSTIGTNYWYDEPVNISGGSVIQQAVTLTGIPSSPIVSNCIVENNSFEYGYISQGNIYTFSSILGNTFKAGQIISGSTSGSNYTTNAYIADNLAFTPLTGQTCFILLNGYNAYSNFISNSGFGFTYLINNNGASTGDIGRCAFINNIINSGTNVLGFSISSLSVESSSIKNGPSNTILVKDSLSQSNVFFSPIATYNVSSTGSYIIDWNQYKSQAIFVFATSNNLTATITNILNTLGDGQQLTIISGSSGSGTTVLQQGASIIAGTIQLKGGVNAVMVFNQMITLINRANIWWELSRSF